MYIFSFWEPKENIPAYLKLCLSTWKKFLPDAEIHIIDFENILNYVDIRQYGANLFSGNFTLPQIADAVRAMLLEKYGGLWMDIDTIILRNDFERYVNFDKDITFFGYTGEFSPHICWINAKAHSDILKYWVDENTERIKSFTPSVVDDKFWGYLGNFVIDPYIEVYPEQVEIIDVIKENCMPEKKMNISYTDYYFNRNYKLQDLNSSMLFLHNSWTPREIKSMSEKDFLSLNCSMSNILKGILEL